LRRSFFQLRSGISSEKDPVTRNKVPFFVRYADRDFRFHVGRDGLHEDKPPQEAHERRLFASL